MKLLRRFLSSGLISTAYSSTKTNKSDSHLQTGELTPLSGLPGDAYKNVTTNDLTHREWTCQYNRLNFEETLADKSQDFVQCTESLISSNLLLPSGFDWSSDMAFPHSLLGVSTSSDYEPSLLSDSRASTTIGSDSCDSGVLVDMLTCSSQAEICEVTGRQTDAHSNSSNHATTEYRLHDASANVYVQRGTWDAADSSDDNVLSSIFSEPDDSLITTQRTVNEISSSLAANIARLRRDRKCVDDAFSKARCEQRLKARELARIKRQTADARRGVLIRTVEQLSQELEGQCRRLQVAYDTVLTARWPKLHCDGPKKN